MKTRAMTNADLPQVLAIEAQSFPLPYSENLFLMELDLNVARMRVLEVEGVIRAYLDFWHVSDELHVINVAVDPAVRQQGLGSQLMEDLMSYAAEHEIQHIYLDVRESNRAAIALYSKFGFKQIDLRKGYYQDNNEDALVMMWSRDEVVENILT